MGITNNKTNGSTLNFPKLIPPGICAKFKPNIKNRNDDDTRKPMIAPSIVLLGEILGANFFLNILLPNSLPPK